MAHFKCMSCRARVWRDSAPEADALCPGCGRPLERVARAEEIIGMPALRTRPRDRRSIGDQVREAIARNDAARTARLDSGHGDPPQRNAD